MANIWTKVNIVRVYGQITEFKQLKTNLILRWVTITFCLFFNGRNIRQICQILLISSNFRKKLKWHFIQVTQTRRSYWPPYVKDLQSVWIQWCRWTSHWHHHVEPTTWKLKTNYFKCQKPLLFNSVCICRHYESLKLHIEQICTSKQMD